MEKEVDKWINDMKVSASGNVLLYRVNQTGRFPSES